MQGDYVLSTLLLMLEYYSGLCGQGSLLQLSETSVGRDLAMTMTPSSSILFLSSSEHPYWWIASSMLGSCLPADWVGWCSSQSHLLLSTHLPMLRSLSPWIFSQTHWRVLNFEAALSASQSSYWLRKFPLWLPCRASTNLWAWTAQARNSWWSSMDCRLIWCYWYWTRTQ